MPKVIVDISGINRNVPNRVRKFDPSYVTRYVMTANIVDAIAGRRKLKVLDVGGYNGASAELLKECDVTVLDMFKDDTLEKYVQYDGKTMPFPDDSFDVVISCDTLEHVLPEWRDNFVSEMTRVSKDYVVLGAPFGTELVEAAELRADKYYQGMTKEKGYIWLKEHREYGLPKKDWFESALKKHGCKFTSFDHTSLLLWEIMLKDNFFLASNLEQVVPAISKRLKKLNDEYLDDVTFNDFPDHGYRSFYVCSKKSEVSIVAPRHDQYKIETFLAHQAYLSGKYAQEVTRALGMHVDMVVEKTHALITAEDRVKQLEKELTSVKSSRAYRSARRVKSIATRVRNRS